MQPGKRHCDRGLASFSRPRKAPFRPEPAMTMDPRPEATVGRRWANDPGAMPGEPFQFLDVERGDLDTAGVALIEVATETGKVSYLAVKANGRSLGVFQTPQEAAKAAELAFPNPSAGTRDFFPWSKTFHQ